MLAACAISPNVTMENSATAASTALGNAPRGGTCHSPSQANAPVISMNTNASSAAPSCFSIKAFDTPVSVQGAFGLADANHLLGGVSAHVGGKRHQRDAQEHHQAGALQIVAFPGQADQEQADSDDRADGREMIEQQMDVGKVHT